LAVTASTSFRDRYRDLQHLVRELTLVRGHNRRFGQSDRQDTLLLFDEGALVLLVLERFLRAILGPVEAKGDDTLPNLLEKATSKRLQLLVLPAADNQKAIRTLVGVRNTLLHANYEQAAAGAKQASVEAYFKSQYASEVEALHQITDHLMAQIDADTGKRRP
jgi:hypothetical protein